MVDEERYQLNLDYGQEDTGKLQLPNGSTIRVSINQIDSCLVAAAVGMGTTIAVFVEEELSFTIDDYVKTIHPLSESIAISKKGYIAYHSGEGQEQVFNLVTWEGETVLQRVSEMARGPKFTPDGDFVAFWSLVDDMIYCYDVEAAEEYGRFDPEAFRGSDKIGHAVNIGLEGVEYDGEIGYKISDTYSQGENELLGYITPNGSIIRSCT